MKGLKRKLMNYPLPEADRKGFTVVLDFVLEDKWKISDWR